MDCCAMAIVSKGNRPFSWGRLPSSFEWIAWTRHWNRNLFEYCCRVSLHKFGKVFGRTFVISLERWNSGSRCYLLVLFLWWISRAYNRLNFRGSILLFSVPIRQMLGWIVMDLSDVNHWLARRWVGVKPEQIGNWERRNAIRRTYFPSPFFREKSRALALIQLMTQFQFLSLVLVKFLRFHFLWREILQHCSCNTFSSPTATALRGKRTKRYKPLQF